VEPENEKKERVIHMRVAPSLDSELKERAEHLGVSVSNLVRNILHHTFGLAGDVIRDSQNVARTARGETPPPADTASTPRAEAPGKVLGWQTFVLGVNAICEHCNAILPRGTEAGIGVLDGPGHRPIICKPCITESTHASRHDESAER